MKRLLLTLGVGSLCVLAAALQPLFTVVVSGPSMSPTYHSGEFLLATKNTGELHRGDVVIVHHQEDTIIKRVAFIAGDRFPEYYYKDAWTIPLNELVVSAMERRHFHKRMIRIPEGRVFIVGDNPCESEDSRIFGSIPVSSIVAKAISPKVPLDEPYFPDVQLSSHQWMASR